MPENYDKAPTNYDIRDEIREYWSLRAPHFDASPGHGIRDGAEKKAWLKMLERQIGAPNGRAVLDLACGTGEISHLLHDYGLKVTGLDWSDTMLAIARKKALERESGIRFITGDAESTREPTASFDLIVNRHLVWTLVDPATAFAHWFTLLKPGGSLLVIDGDFTQKTLLQRFLRWLNRNSTEGTDPKMQELNTRIRKQIYFNEGARAGQIVDMLTASGFEEITVQKNLFEIKKAQAGHMGVLKGLERVASHRYIINARKPLAE